LEEEADLETEGAAEGGGGGGALQASAAASASEVDLSVTDDAFGVGKVKAVVPQTQALKKQIARVEVFIVATLA
jgi:hypothetical protein